MMQPMRSSREPLIVLAALLACFGLFEVCDYGRKTIGYDYYQYWVAARVAGQAQWGDIYAPESGARIGRELLERARAEPGEARRLAVARGRAEIDFFQTPWLISVLRWASGPSYESSYRTFRAVSLVSCALAIGALALLVGHRPAFALVAVGLAAYSFQPLLSDVRVGNVNQLQLAVLALFLGGQRLSRQVPRWQVASGAILVSAVAFKPNLIWVPVFLLAAWAAGGRFAELRRQGLGMALGGGLVLAVTAWVFGSLDVWLRWAKLVRSIPPENIPLRIGNFAPARWVWERFGVELSLPLLLGGLLVNGAVLWISRRSHDPLHRDVAWVGLGCLLFLTSSHLVWQHYLLLTLPLLLYLLRPQAAESRRQRRWVRVRWLGAGACWLLIAIDPLTDLLEIRELAEQALLVHVGLLVAWVLALADLCLERRYLRERPSIAAPLPTAAKE